MRARHGANTEPLGQQQHVRQAPLVARAGARRRVPGPHACQRDGSLAAAAPRRDRMCRARHVVQAAQRQRGVLPRYEELAPADTAPSHPSRMTKTILHHNDILVPLKILIYTMDKAGKEGPEVILTSNSRPALKVNEHM